MVKKNSLRQKTADAIGKAAASGDAFLKCRPDNIGSVRAYVSIMRNQYPDKIFQVEAVEGGAVITTQDSFLKSNIETIVEQITDLEPWGHLVFPDSQKGGYTPDYLRSRIPELPHTMFKTWHDKKENRIIIFRIPSSNAPTDDMI